MGRVCLVDVEERRRRWRVLNSIFPFFLLLLLLFSFLLFALGKIGRLPFVNGRLRAFRILRCEIGSDRFRIPQYRIGCLYSQYSYSKRAGFSRCSSILTSISRTRLICAAQRGGMNRYIYIYNPTISQSAFTETARPEPEPLTQTKEPNGGYLYCK